jgi:hypothetical protein
VDASARVEPVATDSSKHVEAQEPKRPRLNKVVITDRTLPSQRPIAWGDTLKATIEAALVAEDRFERSDKDDGCKAEYNIYYALVRNRQMVQVADAGTARVGFEAMVHCLHKGDVQTYRVEVSKRKDYQDAQAAGVKVIFNGLLQSAASDAAEQLFGQVAVRHSSDGRILELLDPKARIGMVMEAAIEAGERRLEAGSPKLVNLTRHENAVVRMRAAAALGLLKATGKDALRALVKMTSGSNLEEHVVAVAALADIGSKGALRYLKNIARSHPDESIRALAKSGVLRAESEAP